MEKHTLEYIKWADLRSEICKEMGIEEKQFRNYHGVVGGEYKDLWHFWLWLIDHRLYNGEVMSFCYEPEREEYFINSMKEKFGEWPMDFLDALEAVLEREIGKDKWGSYSTNIYYYW